MLPAMSSLICPKLRARAFVLLIGVAGLSLTAGAGDPFPPATPSIAIEPISFPPASPPSLRRITPQGQAPTGASDGNRGLPSLGTVIYGLAIVVFLIFVVARLWKSHGPQPPAAVNREAMQVLGRCRIEPRQSLYLVKVGSRVLVVGSSGGSLAPVAEITDPIEVDLIAGLARQSTEASPFSRLFSAKQAGESAAAGSASTSFADAIPPQTQHTEPRSSLPKRPSPEQRLADRLRDRATAQEADRAA